jgi:hypothetical protein
VRVGDENRSSQFDAGYDFLEVNVIGFDDINAIISFS